MLRNTLSIFNKLKAANGEGIIFHSDGLEIENLGSMRLSNIPRNVGYSLNTSLKILFFLAECTAALPFVSQYISSPDQINNYRFDTTQPNLIKIHPGDCNLTVQQHPVSYPYERTLLHWDLKEMPGRYIAWLLRGEGEPINYANEGCLTTLALEQINKIEHGLAETRNRQGAEASLSSHNGEILFGSLIGSITFILCFGLAANLVYLKVKARCYPTTEDRLAPSMASNNNEIKIEMNTINDVQSSSSVSLDEELVHAENAESKLDYNTTAPLPFFNSAAGGNKKLASVSVIVEPNTSPSPKI